MTDLSEFADATPSTIIRTAELLGNGVTTRGIGVAVRRGILTRIYRGAYVNAAAWNTLSPELKYGLLVRAVSEASKRPLVLSHHSAAVLHGLPLVSRWPAVVHALTPDARGGSSRAFVRTHSAPPDPSTIAIDGMLVTSLRRTVVDLAASCDFVDGVSVVDAHLRRPPGTRSAEDSEAKRDALLRELEAVSPTRGAAKARRAIEFGDPRSESVGESLSRARMAELGFEVPEVQVGFPTGSANYVVDFYWRSAHLIGEFDGRAKYSRSDLTGGKPPEEIVWREKRREDSIRASSHARFLRWTWSSASNRVEFAHFLASQGVPRVTYRRPHKF